jgi:pimeloyl-ACP methyl ester carboxylesterase
MRHPCSRAISLAVMVVSVLPVTGSQATEEALVDLPVVFSVINKNDSKLPCGKPDGLRYSVRGSLVAPAALLEAPERAVTLYLHGTTVGEFQWHFREFRSRGYDFAWEMAKTGHASVTIDQLGYGNSDHPNGNDLCTGTMADVAHQIVSALRTGGAPDGGGYSLNGEAGISFGRVAIAGQSWGMLVAQIEAYSFGDVDGLIEHGMNNQPLLVAHFLPLLAPFAVSCARGGDDGSGYAYSWSDPELERLSVAWQMEPDVWEAVKERLLPDSCGNSDSNGDAMFGPEQWLHVGEIDVPVLIIAGKFDICAGPIPVTSDLQAARMTASPDVTVRTIADQGHAGQFEPTKTALFDAIEDWLQAHSF